MGRDKRSKGKSRSPDVYYTETGILSKVPLEELHKLKVKAGPNGQVNWSSQNLNLERGVDDPFKISRHVHVRKFGRAAWVPIFKNYIKVNQEYPPDKSTHSSRKKFLIRSRTRSSSRNWRSRSRSVKRSRSRLRERSRGRERSRRSRSRSYEKSSSRERKSTKDRHRSRSRKRNVRRQSRSRRKSSVKHRRSKSRSRSRSHYRSKSREKRYREESSDRYRRSRSRSYSPYKRKSSSPPRKRKHYSPLKPGEFIPGHPDLAFRKRKVASRSSSPRSPTRSSGPSRGSPERSSSIPHPMSGPKGSSIPMHGMDFGYIDPYFGPMIPVRARFPLDPNFFSRMYAPAVMFPRPMMPRMPMKPNRWPVYNQPQAKPSSANKPQPSATVTSGEQSEDASEGMEVVRTDETTLSGTVSSSEKQETSTEAANKDS